MLHEVAKHIPWIEHFGEPVLAFLEPVGQVSPKTLWRLARSANLLAKVAHGEVRRRLYAIKDRCLRVPEILATSFPEIIATLGR